MFIRFVLEESNDNTTITDQPDASKSGYTYGPPELVDALPANTAANTVITTDTADTKQKCYYYDCQNLDRATVERAVSMFNAELFEDAHHGLSSIVLQEEEPLSFLKIMKQALEKAKQEPRQEDRQEIKQEPTQEAKEEVKEEVKEEIKREAKVVTKQAAKQEAKPTHEGFNVRNYVTNRNLLFAGAGVATIGAVVAAVAAYRRYGSTE